MCSIIVFAILGLAFPSAMGEPIRLDYLERRADYTSISTCLGEGYVYGADEAAKNPPHSDAERAAALCPFFQKVKECIRREIESFKPGTVPKILYLTAAYEYQHLFMAHKSGLCLDVSYDALKNIAKESGVMDPGSGWKDIEDDHYSNCIGKLQQHCFCEMEKSFEEQNNMVSPSFNYVECYEGDATAIKPFCGTPRPMMLQSFIDNGRGILKKEWDDIQ